MQCVWVSMLSTDCWHLVRQSKCPDRKWVWFVTGLCGCSGSVEVYSCDESTGEWSPSHTLQFTRSQFPVEKL